MVATWRSPFTWRALITWRGLRYTPVAEEVPGYPRLVEGITVVRRVELGQIATQPLTAVFARLD